MSLKCEPASEPLHISENQTPDQVIMLNTDAHNPSIKVVSETHKWSSALGFSLRTFENLNPTPLDQGESQDDKGAVRPQQPRQPPGTH